MIYSRIKLFVTVFIAALAAQTVDAAPARIGIVGLTKEHAGPVMILKACEPLAADARVTVFSPGKGGASLGADTKLDDFDALFVDGSTPGVEAAVPALKKALGHAKVFVLQPPAGLEGNVSPVEHPWLAEYWSNSSQKNYARLVRYMVARVLGRPLSDGRQPEAPEVYPAAAFYHPDAPGLFASFGAYEAWLKGRTPTTKAPTLQVTVAVAFGMPFYKQDDLAHIDALLRAVEKRGHVAVGLVSSGGADLDKLVGAEGKPLADVVIFNGERLHLNDYREGLARARRLGLPILSAIGHAKWDEADFARSKTGLHPERTPELVNNERDGIIEPLVIGGRGAGGNFVPFAAQVEWRAERAISWGRLHKLANGDKRIAFTYWSEGAGKANVGGDPDDFLDVPASLVRLFAAMKARGYDLGGKPLPERDALVSKMSLEASNVGNWAPGELAARVKNAEVALIPEATYKAWFDALPGSVREAVVETWGPPPGKIMVYEDAAGHRSLVVPKLEFGKVLLAPHPDWGYIQDAKALMSAGALPPHHQYLAFFLWLQKEWKADAFVPLFSNIELQPGKSEGPASDDPIGVLLGGLPHIHPERLGSNGGMGNKRKALAQLTSWFNIVVPSDGSERLYELRASLGRYASQPDAKLRADGEPTIRKQALEAGLDRALEIDLGKAPFADVYAALKDYLNDLERAHMPHGTKILGDPPEGSALSDMVAAMLGGELREALAPYFPELKDADKNTRIVALAAAARPLVAAVVLERKEAREALTARFGRSTPEAEAKLALAADYAGRLRAAPREIEALLTVLEGRRIEPGPMDEPMHRPDSVPPGRSIYNFDQNAMPTPEAEAIGIKQAEAVIAAHREKNGGAYPRKLAFVMWSGEIAKNHGVTEAEILHLLGTRVVRNERGEVTGVALIPRTELGRPRVDVLATTSGAYRDHFQDKVKLISEATRLAASSPEPDNPVAEATQAAEAKLRASGESAERARNLALVRVYSPAPNAYSPSIQFLAKSGDQRGDEARMAELYTKRLSFAYGDGVYGESARPAFEQNLKRVDAATLPRSSNVNGMLDNPMPAGFLGGLNLAAKAVTGKNIDLYVSRLNDPENPSTESATRALQTELRTRYFNPKWLKEMKEHGYDGARNLMFMTDHLDLWDSTATQVVSSADWAEVKSVYVDDKLGLQMDAFFDRYNPHAQQVLLGNLLGAAKRGHWQASAEDLRQVAKRLAESAVAHGAACEAGICRNEELTKTMDETLSGTPEGTRLMQAYREVLEKVATPAPADLAPAPSAAATAAPSAAPAPAPAVAAPTTPEPSVVQGKVLEEVSRKPAEQASPASDTWPLRYALLALAATVLLVVGWYRQGLRR